jgi:hypothetical protein
MAEPEKAPSAVRFSLENGYTHDLDIKSIDGYPLVYVSLTAEEKDARLTILNKSTLFPVVKYNSNPRFHHSSVF